MATTENSKTALGALEQMACEVLALCRAAVPMLDDVQDNPDAFTAQRLMLIVESTAGKMLTTATTA